MAKYVIVSFRRSLHIDETMSGCLPFLHRHIFRQSWVCTHAADPVWQHLKSAKGGFLTADIKWNFSKVRWRSLRRLDPCFALCTLPPRVGTCDVCKSYFSLLQFLIDKDGNVSKRYGSTTTPEDIEADVLALL